MTQNALRKELEDQVEPQVSEALSSIRDVIRANLESGFEGFANPVAEEKKVLKEPSTKPSLESNVMLLRETNMEPENEKVEKQDKAPAGDVFYLTQVLEEDGSITTLEKKETGMSDIKKNEAEAPQEVETKQEVKAEAPVDSPDETPTQVLETPADDLEIGEPEPSCDIASLETMEESAAAFSELATLVRKMSKNQQEKTDPVTPQTAGSYTVDALMRELLQPMLKDWLDAHLPSLVKWLVTEQIEKMLKNEMGSLSTIAPAEKTDTPKATEGDKTATDESADAAVDPTEAMDFDVPGEKAAG